MNRKIIEKDSGKAQLELLRVLGEGKDGVVYESRLLCPYQSLEKGCRVAVKAYRPETLRLAEQSQRVRREGEMSSHVIHKNVVRIYGVIESDEGPFLIMEYVQGVTLRKVINSGSPGNWVKLSTGVLSGLAAIHEAGIIHRDIKPENILLDQNTGNVKIADFGVARHDLGATITGSDQFLGTIRYAAPAYLINGKSSYQTDQYSVGAVIYELAFGEPVIPLEGTFAAQILKINEGFTREWNQVGRELARTQLGLLRLSLIRELLESYDKSLVESEEICSLFDKGFASPFWKAHMNEEREDCQVAIKGERAQRLKARAKLKELRVKGGLDEQISRFEYALQFEESEEFSIHECPICRERAICGQRWGGDFVGACHICSYHREAKYVEWREKLERFKNRDMLFHLTCLGSRVGRLLPWSPGVKDELDTLARMPSEEDNS